MTNLHVGQDVVCIDAKFPDVSTDQGLREGEVYRIRWLGPFNHYIYGEFIGVKLEGFDRGPDNGRDSLGYDDMPFAARRFRPVVKDPLGSLRQLLANPNGPLPSAPEEPVRRVKETEDA